MKPSDRVITFPIMGRKNSEVIKNFLESLDLNIVLPPQITDKTIKLGVKHSADMICIPYKFTFGNYLEAFEKKPEINTLLTYDSQGTCRFRQYSKLHEFTLKKLGYHFEMHTITPKNIFSKMKELSGKSYLKIFKEFMFHYHELEKNEFSNWSKDKPNIGIIGEIFCAVDEKVNQGLENKIKKFGGNPINASNSSGFIRNQFLFFKTLSLFKKDFMKEYKEKAKNYFNGELGGHSVENISHLLYFIDRKIDGIIHIAPLTCMPETTIENYVHDICSSNNIPLLKVPIDENNSEANLETRLETYLELIKMKKE